jgi:hypothetical protein
LTETTDEYLRLALIEYVWGRDDLPVADKLDKLMKIIQINGNMKTITFIQRVFDGVTSAQTPFYDPKYIAKWWTDHGQALMTP